MSEVEISVIMGVLNPAAPHHLHQAAGYGQSQSSASMA